MKTTCLSKQELFLLHMKPEQAEAKDNDNKKPHAKRAAKMPGQYQIHH